MRPNAIVTFNDHVYVHVVRQLGRTILVVAVQSDVAYAVHRLRSVPAAVVDRHVADHVVDDQRSHVLRSVPGTRHEFDTELGFV